MELENREDTAWDAFSRMEPTLHDLHGLAAVMTAAVNGMADSSVDRPLVIDGLSRLSAMICDMAGEMKDRHAEALDLLASEETKVDDSPAGLRLVVAAE